MTQPSIRMPRRPNNVRKSVKAVRGRIHPQWREAARTKGFVIKARVRDRYHLSLECRTCGALNVQRIFTLMSANPICQECLERRWAKDARDAGISWLGRDPKRRHYSHYRLKCGHEATRQVALVQRVARGETGIRCNICNRSRDRSVAKRQGWELLGPAPSGRPNYRSYRHVSCGHEQEISTGNMRTARYGCGRCHPGWCAAPSHIYLFRISLPDGRRWVKPGYARNPTSRSKYQLDLAEGVTCDIVHQIPQSSGQVAIGNEKALHKALKLEFPGAVIHRTELSPWINVVSEVYAEWLEGEILKRLHAMAAVPDAA